MVVLHESRADESFANVGNRLVTEVVSEFEPVVFALVDAFSTDELQTFGIPSATITC